MTALRYSQVMGGPSAHLTLKLDTAEPIELGDFVGAFTSLANEFERFVAESYPDKKADPTMYVREVRAGCIEADMITGLAVIGQHAIHHMDQILILEEFVKRWGSRLTSLITGNVPPGELDTNAQLTDFYRATEAIASDPVASHRLEAATFEDGKRQVRAGFQFSAVEARSAQVAIEDRRRLLSKPEVAPFPRVLMQYTRTDLHDAALNKRSGERVLIREITEAEKPVMYASEMAEQEIRQIIREDDDNVYKKGFVVDVVSQTNPAGTITAFSIVHLHNVIDLDG